MLSGRQRCGSAALMSRGGYTLGRELHQFEAILGTALPPAGKTAHGIQVHDSYSADAAAERGDRKMTGHHGFSRAAFSTRCH
ncbi:hypothetical protein RGI145_24025 (plasmid) [Roseomonas gilardii]|uniref:Uncharacterized protein n=1 Tax=Roseomonas gilardii TaxID=257708 RepID=A0A1L7ANR1_9PROT|nr:hypothetical protein RGI145_24025 [Roseomonas gilardii]